jgi:hypothetical protein
MNRGAAVALTALAACLAASCSDDGNVPQIAFTNDFEANTCVVEAAAVSGPTVSKDRAWLWNEQVAGAGGRSSKREVVPGEFRLYAAIVDVSCATYQAEGGTTQRRFIQSLEQKSATKDTVLQFSLSTATTQPSTSADVEGLFAQIDAGVRTDASPDGASADDSAVQDGQPASDAATDTNSDAPTDAPTDASDAAKDAVSDTAPGN